MLSQLTRAGKWLAQVGLVLFSSPWSHRLQNLAHALSLEPLQHTQISSFLLQDAGFFPFYLSHLCLLLCLYNLCMSGLFATSFGPICDKFGSITLETDKNINCFDLQRLNTFLFLNIDNTCTTVFLLYCSKGKGKNVKCLLHKIGHSLTSSCKKEALSQKLFLEL